jgi:tRNA(Ile)-lysidine synthase
MARQDLAFEQHVLRSIKPLKARPRRLLLAVSGGVDSMVMAEILFKWRQGLKFELVVAHVHHGRSNSAKQNIFRSKAREFVRAWALKRDLPFFTNDQAPALRNESDMREFREGLLKTWRQASNCDSVAYAHHEDDLLETRLIRLIRGAGAQGLRAMSGFRGGKFRPLLGVSRAEIEAYAEHTKLKWVEDPSNCKTDVLRNWLRHEWLPSLEAQRQGAVKALARSLETVAPRTQEFDLAACVGLRRDRLSPSLVAQYLKALGLRGYAQTHVEEILKRVSSPERNLEFDMLGFRFQVSREFLWASRV